MAVDLWTLARTPSWSFTLLDAQDRPLGNISHAVRGGRCEMAYFERLGGSAEVELSDRGDRIDFMRHRLAVTYDPGVAGLDPLPIGVYTFASPKLNRLAAAARRWTVAMYPKTDIIDTDSFAESFSLAAGTPIIPAVVSIIQSSNETRIAVTPSDATLTTPQVWEAGISKLTIINDLLTSAGYGSLWCDGSGQFRVEPYIEPGARPVLRTFAAGDWSIHYPEWSREQELSNVPNRVVVVAEGTDDQPCIVGVAENWNSDSPFSIPSRDGRVITRREEVSDISSQGEADALAQRYLIGGMSPVATLEVTHGIVPLNPGDAISFESEGEPVRRATVQRMEMEFRDGSQCRATWREVSI